MARALPALAALVVAAVATRAFAQDEEADPASAAPAPAPPAVDRATVAPAETVVGVGGVLPDAARLVTSAGRVFARGEGGAWTLRSSGGVATPLASARSFGSAELWAAGASPPAFRFGADAATWSAVPVRRSGSARLGTCATPGFATGRRVFAHDGKRWKELRRLPGAAALVTLCLVDASHGAALLDDGTLLALAGGPWKPVVVPALGRVTWLGGGATPLLTNERDELYRLDAARPARVVTEAPVVPRATFSTARHTFVLGDAAVYRLDGRKLVNLAALPADLGAHHFIGLVASDDGALVLVARDGLVARRSADGVWSREAALGASAVAAPRAANPPARVGP